MEAREIVEKDITQLDRTLYPTESLREITRGKCYAIYDDASREQAIVMVELHPKKSTPEITTIKLKRPRTKLGWKLIEYIIEGLRHCRNLIPFVLENESATKFMEYLYRSRSRSIESVKTYAYAIKAFCDYVGKGPDEILGECLNPEGLQDEKKVLELSKKLDDYLGELDASDYAPISLRMRQGYIVSFFRVNGLTLKPQSRYPVRVRYRGRAPTPQELQKLIDVSGLREKAMIAMLATSGMRIGTLLKLKYRHVREDLEAGMMPVHIHIEADITKGKYADYDTFMNEEAVHYLKLYLEARKMGTEKIPAEKIDGDSPLFANAKVERKPKGSDHGVDHAADIESERLIVKPLSYSCISRVLFRNFKRAGLIAKDEKRHQLRIHSLRKFFRTQLTTLGMPTDYVEYMMGHKLSTYNTIEMKGIDFLRSVYAATNLRIFPKEKASLADVLREIRSRGEDPGKYLKERMMGGRDLVSPEDEAEIYARAVWEMLRKELMRNDYSTPEPSNSY